MNTKTIFKWLTIGWMSLGLSVPVGGTEKNVGDDSDNKRKALAPVATTGEKPVDYQLILVADEKPVAPTGEEGLYRPPSRGAPGECVTHSGAGPYLHVPAHLRVSVLSHKPSYRENSPTQSPADDLAGAKLARTAYPPPCRPQVGDPRNTACAR